MGPDHLAQHLEYSMLTSLHSLDGDEGRIELWDYLDRVFTSAKSWGSIRSMVEQCRHQEKEDFLPDLFVKLLKPQSHYRDVLRTEKAARLYLRETARNASIDLLGAFKDRSLNRVENLGHMQGKENFILMNDVFASLPSKADRDSINSRNYRDREKLRLKLKTSGTIEESICVLLRVASLVQVPTETLLLLGKLLTTDHDLADELQKLINDRRSRSYAPIN